MNNQELKKEKWETYKHTLFDVVPEQYTVICEELDTSSVYFHPLIQIDADCYIRGQGDVNTNYFYGFDLVYNDHSFDIETSQIKSILENIDEYKEYLLPYIRTSKAISENIELLEFIRFRLSNAIIKKNDIDERQEIVNQLYDVKQWIDGNRILQKY